MGIIIGRTGNGYEFKISQEDADLLELTWTGIQLQRHDRLYTYAVRRKRRGRGSSQVRMHRIILQRMLGTPLPRSLICNHKDGDTLNNCRDNIRPATHAQNRHNGVRNLRNRSGYRGVSWNNARKEWHCTIMCNGKHHFVGWFKDKHEAARRYNKKASELYGEFAKLNEICPT
jgi:HNH endonuclease